MILNQNKNKILVSFVVFLLLIIIPEISSASFISLEPSSKKVKVDETFNVSIYVVPTTSSVVYTTQVAMDFPAEIVSVESFDYDPSWVLINQPSYDLVDNENGKFIKTLGYPSGFSEKMLLGTLVLKAKKAGSIDLSINNESFVLDKDNNDTLDDYESLSVPSKDPSRNIFTRLWNLLFG